MARRALQDRRVLITGASRGVGRALALEFAKRGSRLLLLARSADLLSQLVAELPAAGAAGADFLAGDVTDSGFRAEVTNWVTHRWNGLDVLVNNAGVSAIGEFASHDEAMARRIMEVNFFAATELTRCLLPHLAQGTESVVVNIGSILGHRGVPFVSEYVASKFALRGWSESLRAELHPQGIDVLLVSPGSVDTEFFDHVVAKTEELPWKTRGIPAAAVAAQTVRAVERRRTEIFPNWQGRLLVAVNRGLPRIVDRVMNRYGRQGQSH
jgi:short-subunit dehydrogenase